MPGAFANPTVDLDAQDQAAGAMPVPQSERFAEDFGHFDFTRRAAQFGKHLVLDTLNMDTSDPLQTEGDARLSSDTANERYGVPGYLRFNVRTSEQDAAWQSAQAQERQYRDTVFAATKAAPLRDFGLSLAGGLVDPAGLSLMVATDGLGEAAVGASGLGGLARGLPAMSVVGRVANVGRVAAEGAINQVPYVAANAGLTNYAGDSYEPADALRDIAMGAVLHTGMHYAGAGVHALGARLRGDPSGLPIDALDRPQGPVFEPDAAPVEGRPAAVAALPEVSRLGAFAKAVDDAASDRPVDVGRYVEQELGPEGLQRLNDTQAATRTIGEQTAAFHDPAQAAMYDLGAKLNAAGRGAASPELAAEVEAVRHAMGPWLDFSSDLPRAAQDAASGHDLAAAAKARAGLARAFEADGVTPKTALMTRYLKAWAKSIEDDPATAGISAYDPDKAPDLAGRPIEPVPIKGAPSGAALAPEASHAKSPGPADRPAADGAPAKGAGQGAAPDGARQQLANLAQRFATGDAGKLDLRAPGKPEGGAGAAKGDGLDLRAGEDGAGGKRGGGDLAGNLDHPDAADRGAGRPTADQLIAADPELKALAEDTDRLAAENGVKTPEPPGNENPSTLAEAIRAAAVCLSEEAA